MSDTAEIDSGAELLAKQTSRRRFLKDSAVTALIAGVATACKPETKAASAAQAKAQTGGTMGAHDTVVGATGVSAADAMDAMHEKGIKAFPAKTAGLGNQIFKPTMDGTVKVFE